MALWQMSVLPWKWAGKPYLSRSLPPLLMIAAARYLPALGSAERIWLVSVRCATVLALARNSQNVTAA